MALGAPTRKIGGSRFLGWEIGLFAAGHNAPYRTAALRCETRSFARGQAWSLSPATLGKMPIQTLKGENELCPARRICVDDPTPLACARAQRLLPRAFGHQYPRRLNRGGRHVSNIAIAHTA